MSESVWSRWRHWVRPQDLVWIPLFFALAAASKILDALVVIPLVTLFVVQVVEAKIPGLANPGWRVLWILLKIAIVYVLIGFTGGI